MTGKHTPGPWKAYHRHIVKHNYGTFMTIGGERVALDHAIADADEGPTDAESVANATLMAASPELLQALRDLLLIADFDPSTCKAPVRMRELFPNRFAAAEDAISKAEGK